MEVGSTTNIVYNKSNGELTKYPNIFEGQYWSRGLFNDPDFEIIDNRNNFVEEFNITKDGYNVPEYVMHQIHPQYVFARIQDNFQISDRYTQKELDILAYMSYKNITSKFHMDHIEYYESNDYWIGIFSPYVMTEEDDLSAINFGYEHYKTLYGGAKTYIKKIPKSIKYKDTNKIFKKLY